MPYDPRVLRTLQAMMPGHKLQPQAGKLVFPAWETARQMFMEYFVADEAMRRWPHGLSPEYQDMLVREGGFNATGEWWIRSLFAGRLLPVPTQAPPTQH